MEVSNLSLPRVGETCHFMYSNKEKEFAEIQSYLKKINATDSCISTKVTLHLGNEHLTIDATLLAAFSSFWRESLTRTTQESQIFYRISTQLSSDVEYLPLLKSLLYLGEATLSGGTVDDLVEIVQELQLEYNGFMLTQRESEKVIIWNDHCNQLLKGLQSMCIKQLCTDVQIFVDGHVINAHKLVLGAYSSVLAEAFQESSKTKIIHLPGYSCKSVQSLLAFMYYGKGKISSDLVEELDKLGRFLKVKSLAQLKGQSHDGKDSTSFRDRKSAKVSLKDQVQVVSVVEPEIMLTLKKLRMLFDISGKTDLMLVVGSKRILTHKSIMGISCPAIHAMLMEETTIEPSMILVSDADYLSMSSLITLIYNGTCFMSDVQLEVAVSYLDANLIECKAIKEELKCSRTPPKENPSLVPEKKTTVAEKKNVELRLKACRPRTRSKGRRQSPDEKSSTTDQTPPGKRRRKKLLYNSEEWITDTGKLESILNPDRHRDLHCNECSISFSRKEDFSKHCSSHAGGSSQKALKTESSDEMPKKDPQYEENIFCQFCGKKYLLRRNLLRHLQTKHASEEIEATPSSLDETNTSTDSLRKHPRHKKGNIPFKNKRHLSKHKVKRQNSAFNCKTCNSKFLILEQLVKHKCKIKSFNDRQKKSHTGIKKSVKHRCDKCKFWCLDYEALKLHKQRTHSSWKHKNNGHSKQKNQTFSKNRRKLAKKKSSTKDSTNWDCSHCSFECFGYDKLLNHMNEVHYGLSSGQEMTTSDDDQLSRSQRRISTGYNQSLKSQVTAIGDVQNEGLVKLPSPAAVEEDNVNATAENEVMDFPLGNSESFSCPECGKQFNDLESFSTHAELEGHGGLVGSCWICGVCKHAFAEESELNNHLASHNPLPGQILEEDDEDSQVLEEHDEDSHNTMLDHASDVGQVLSPEDGSSEVHSIKSAVEADSSVFNNETTQYAQGLRTHSPNDMNVVSSSVSNE